MRYRVVRVVDGRAIEGFLLWPSHLFVSENSTPTRLTQTDIYELRWDPDELKRAKEELLEGMMCRP